MQIHLGNRGLAGPVALTMGNFDGVHRGHQAMLRRLREAAHALRLPAVVMSFEPHPRDFFSPEDSPPRITSLREKATCLERADIDHFVVCRFNRTFAAQSAENFMKDWLLQRLDTRWILTGDDFRFGARRAGDVETLRAFGACHGIVVQTQETVIESEERISSSRVRECLAQGDLKHVTKLLGAPWQLEGRIVQGDQVGRQWGFPTANIDMTGRKLPVTGVFAVRMQRQNGESIEGVASMGTRPTVVEQGRQLLEVYLFDFAGDLYGERVAIAFYEKFRDEHRFESVDALKAQIARDVESARRYFEHEKITV